MANNPRRIALEILNKLEKEKIHADDLLGRSFKSKRELSFQEKAFITELVYGVLRWRDTIDWIIGEFSAQPQRSVSRLIRNILRLGIYQVLYLNQIPVPLSVSGTVELTKDLVNEKMASLVNGFLRNVQRNQNTINYPSPQKNPIRAIAIRYSHPSWLVKKWLNHYGLEETISICKANNTAPSFTIRTNTLKITREKLIDHLQQEGFSCGATHCSSDGIIISHPYDITRLASFKKGWFFVQDEAAQMIAFLVSPEPGENILDLCAAPGGKTTHMAQMMNNEGNILAVDVRSDNTLLLKENQSRLGISIISAILADARRLLPLKKKIKFDKLLLDVPCSGLGILRRHPEGKWKKSPEDIIRLKNIQRAIIKNASQYIKRGGVMVYSTCTLIPEENQDLVEEFLSTTGKDFQIENPLPYLPSKSEVLINSRGYLQTFTHRDSMDGFFGVRLRKNT